MDIRRSRAARIARSMFILRRRDLPQHKSEFCKPESRARAWVQGVHESDTLVPLGREIAPSSLPFHKNVRCHIIWKNLPVYATLHDAMRSTILPNPSQPVIGAGIRRVAGSTLTGDATRCLFPSLSLHWTVIILLPVIMELDGLATSDLPQLVGSVKGCSIVPLV